MSEITLARRIKQELTLTKEFSSLVDDLSGGIVTIGLGYVEFIPRSDKEREMRFQIFAKHVRESGIDLTKIKI